MKKLICGILILFPLLLRAQTVSTVAGIAGAVGSNDGPASTATFNNPHGVAIDRSGNLYIANRYGHNIRKITPAGVVSTFAGGGSPGFTDGTGTSAAFNEPWALACDTAGNVYVADTKNYSIRKITPTGNVTTLAGTGTFGVTNGPLLQAQFGFPTGIAVNAAGTIIYVSDRMTHTIRKITGGQVTTLAGTAYLSGSTNGTGSAARFNQPYSIALDTQGNILVADQNNNLIRKVTPAGVVSTYAGSGAMGSVNGPKLSASFNSPWGIACDNYGNAYVGEGNNFLIRKITQDSVLTYAGQDGLAGSTNGPALQSSFNGVSSLVTEASTNILYLCDPFSQLVRKIVPAATQAMIVSTQGGATSFCQGNNITLIASPSGYSNYTFYNGTTVLGTSATNTLTLTAPANGTYAISCTAIGSSGLVTSNTINISVSALPTASISVTGATTICNGDTTVLQANGTGSYLWSNGSTASSISVTTAGTYTVTVTNAAGCTKASSPVQISLLQAPSATIQSASTTPVCPGDSVLLTASASASYLWSNGATSQAVYATTPGNYTVLVTNGAGCSAISLPQQVQFHPASSSAIVPAGTVPLISGNTVTLTANAGQSYLWSNGSTTQSITISATGNYTVTVTDANGCKSTPATSQVVPLSPANMVSYNGNSTVCKGDTVLLVSAFPANNQWFVNGTAITGATSPTYAATQSGTYALQYTISPGNTIFSDSILVTVMTLPATVSTQSDTVCKGEQAQLLASPQSGIACKWYTSPTGGTAVATGNSFTTPSLLQSQSYWVEQVNTLGCTSDSRTEVVAALHPTPVAGFDFGTASSVTNGYQVTFTNTSTTNAAYLWNFGDAGSPDNTSVEPNPVHVYPATGNYVVILIVANSNGCMDTLTQNIAVRQANNIFIPTGFTPNNDGNNDLFRVRGNNIAYSEMSVFSHWGERIFYSEKETKGWDGRLNGDVVPNGNYAYVITVQYETGEQETYKGTISVIR